MGLLQMKLPDGSWAAVPTAGPLLYGKLHMLNGDRWLRHVYPGEGAQQMPLKLREGETWHEPIFMTQAGSRVRTWQPWSWFLPYPAARATQFIDYTAGGFTTYEADVAQPIIAPATGAVTAEYHKTFTEDLSALTWEQRRVVHSFLDLKFIRRRMDLGPGYTVTGVTITLAGTMGARLEPGIAPSGLHFRILESYGELPWGQASIFGSPSGLYTGELLRYCDYIGENFSTTEQGLFELRPGTEIYSDGFTETSMDGNYGWAAWITDRTLTAEQFATIDSIGYTVEVDDILSGPPAEPPEFEVEYWFAAGFSQFQVEIHTDPPTG